MKELFEMLIGSYDFLYDDYDMEFVKIIRRDKSSTWYVWLKIDNRLYFTVNAINTSNINIDLIPCDKVGKPAGKNVDPSFMKQYLLNEEYYKFMKVGKEQAAFLRENMKNIFNSFTKDNITKTYKYIAAFQSKNALERDWASCPEEVRSIGFDKLKALDRLPAYQNKTAKESVLALVDSPEYAQKNAWIHVRHAMRDTNYEPTKNDIDRVLALPLTERFNRELVLSCLEK